MHRQPRRHARAPLSCLVVLASLIAACSPVSHVQIRADYAAVDRTATYRVHLVIALTPTAQPAGDADLGALYGTVARRYVNQHRDFIVRKTSVQATATDCGEHIEAVLWLKPVVRIDGAKVDVSIQGELRRCKGWVRIWSAGLRDTWPSADDQLTELIKRYTAELGPIAKVHAGPAFRALRLLLDTLPRPKLVKDADIDEKIEL